MSMQIDLYCTSRQLPPLTFAHTLHAQRDRGSATLQAHLDDILDALFTSGQEISRQLYALARHLQRTAHHLTITTSSADLEALDAWLLEARGVMLLPDASFRDHRHRILFHPQQPADENAEPPTSKNALRRKTTSHRRLEGEGLSLPSQLPTVTDEDEVLLRSAREVAERALALFLVALRAESVASQDPIPLHEIEIRQPLGFAALSPAERAYLEDPNPPEQSTIEMTWRYEALNLLLWSLGLSQLSTVAKTCDAAFLAGLMMEVEEEEFVSQANLRLTPILLDAFDLHFRYHWATTQLPQHDQELPLGLDPGVLLERYHALNWLTRFKEATWDEVELPL